MHTIEKRLFANFLCDFWNVCLSTLYMILLKKKKEKKKEH